MKILQLNFEMNRHNQLSQALGPWFSQGKIRTIKWTAFQTIKWAAFQTIKWTASYNKTPNETGEGYKQYKPDMIRCHTVTFKMMNN
jgi:hypothetical protein